MKQVILSIIILSISSCGIFIDEYQANQRKVLAYLLSDLPLPKDADIIKEPSVVLGTGRAISGRIVLESGYTPAENLIFYGNQTPSTGWTLESSQVGEEISLVYSKDNRYANIYIKPKTGLGSLMSGSYGSDITISLIHPEAIDVQNPYKDLNYDNLPEDP